MPLIIADVAEWTCILTLTEKKLKISSRQLRVGNTMFLTSALHVTFTSTRTFRCSSRWLYSFTAGFILSG